MLSEKAAVHLVCTEIRYREKHSLFLQNSKKHSVLCNIDGECLNLESALCVQMKLHMRSRFCRFARRRRRKILRCRILFLFCELLFWAAEMEE